MRGSLSAISGDLSRSWSPGGRNPSRRRTRNEKEGRAAHVRIGPFGPWPDGDTVLASDRAGGGRTINSTSLTLPAGVGSEASSVPATVTAVNDNVDDDAETIVIGALLDGVALGDARTVTITDDDGTPVVTLVLTPSSIAEDGGVHGGGCARAGIPCRSRGLRAVRNDAEIRGGGHLKHRLDHGHRRG